MPFSPAVQNNSRYRLLMINPNVPAKNFHFRAGVRLRINPAFEMPLVAAIVLGRQSGLAVDKNLDLMRGRIVDDIKVKPFVINIIKQRFIFIPFQAPVINAQLQRRRPACRAEDLHDGHPARVCDYHEVRFKLVPPGGIMFKRQFCARLGRVFFPHGLIRAVNPEVIRVRFGVERIAVAVRQIIRRLYLRNGLVGNPSIRKSCAGSGAG